jgi:hypothetical protein
MSFPTLPYPFDRYGHKVTSQNDEDGIIAEIIKQLSQCEIFCRFFVEIGAHAHESNCLNLRNAGWSGLFLDAGGYGDWIKKEWVTADNINMLLAKYQVPPIFDVLSIDIDGQDIYVWRALAWRPALVVIEYNGALPIERSVAIPPDPRFAWDRTDWYGASLAALERVGRGKGYVLVYANGINAFFVRRDRFANPDDFSFAAIFKPLASPHRRDTRKRPYVEIS